MVKFRMAAELVPVLLTDANVPAAPVVVPPTVTVALPPPVPLAPLLMVRL
jgi:hypothetical protein